MAKTRAIAYIRVSTEKQAEQGVSLDAQRAKVRAYCELFELELVETVVDAESAKSLDRPELQRALAMLAARKADALLVVKLDRLTRSVRDLGELVDRYFAPGKAALLSMSEQIDTRSAAGRLVLNVLASVSQWEREAIGERTSAALQHMASLGEYTGGAAPYGFRLSACGRAAKTCLKGGGCGHHPTEHGILLDVAAEQEVIARVVAARSASPAPSLRDICAELTTAGYVSRTGKPFVAAQVARMLSDVVGDGRSLSATVPGGGVGGSNLHRVPAPTVP